MAAVSPTLRRPFIAGNWKMNLDHLQAIAVVQKLAWSLADAHHRHDEVEVSVFPPFTDLRSVQTLIDADKLDITFGAQDVSEHESGAFTGEVSASLLARLGCRYVIVGHSERRALHGESDEVVARKAAAAHAHGLVPVVCVGENAEDRERFGQAAVPIKQLRAVVAALPRDAEFVVAYEPVWAIGSGNPATPEEAQAVAAALRELVADTLGDEAAGRTRIVYGGSVKAANIAGFMRQPDVDGALVGGASLKPEEFSAIAQYRNHVGV
ncbi:MAG TPA: triose-phosphate isomerase [Microbacteriaceae bacterium]|nr:triose-phosphate isomerase [Microbacteriaceae bacterium]